MVNRKNEDAGKINFISNMMKNTSPLKSRTQVLHVKKTFPEASNVATYYTLKKASKFVPYPYEHLIQGGRHRRPATQTTPKQRNLHKGYFLVKYAICNAYIILILIVLKQRILTYDLESTFCLPCKLTKIIHEIKIVEITQLISIISL